MNYFVRILLLSYTNLEELYKLVSSKRFKQAPSPVVAKNNKQVALGKVSREGARLQTIGRRTRRRGAWREVGVFF